MQKGISIILPTLNRADYLASTVDCLIEQDFGEPYEIIIVDQSAAIDSTMYSRAKDSDTLIKYYHVTEFRGLPEARNFGVQHTQYAYILFLDDDIECDCNLLKEHYKFLSQPDIAVVAGGITEKYKNNPKSKNVGKFHFYTATPERGFHINHKEYVDHGGGGNYSIKKDIFLEVGGVDEYLNYGAALYEETEICLRVKELGYKVFFNYDAHVWHLAADTGGCRVLDINRYIASLVHNRALLISRHLKWYHRPTAYIYLLRLVASYAFTYRNPGLFRLFAKTLRVFTPVYNRKNLIGNLYQSLLSQTYKNFEWIIVDDGSTDDIDEIIKSYQNEDRILIRFIKQENGGKHRAINNGVLHAKGELFYIVDSDDYLTKDSIERIVFHYQYIKNNDKFAGVCGMKCFPDGSRIGKEVTWKILKDSWINYWIIKNIKGDVAFVFKTSVLRNYLFDDIPGEKFCAESLVLNRIGKNYLMLFFNEKIYIAEYLSDGLSVSSIKNRMNSPNYAMRIYSEMASLDIPYLKKIKAHINYWRFAPCSKLKMKNKIKQIGISSYIIFMPIGYLFHMKDKKNNYIDIRHVGSKR